MNNGLCTLFGQKHLNEDEQHGLEILHGLAIRNAVVWPTFIVDLANYMVAFTQKLITDIESSQDKVLTQLLNSHLINNNLFIDGETLECLVSRGATTWPKLFAFESLSFSQSASCHNKSDILLNAHSPEVLDCGREGTLWRNDTAVTFFQGWVD